MKAKAEAKERKKIPITQRGAMKSQRTSKIVASIPGISHEFGKVLITNCCEINIWTRSCTYVNTSRWERHYPYTNLAKG